MTPKHYEEVARLIARLFAKDADRRLYAAVKFSRIFAEADPNFDVESFRAVVREKIVAK